MAEHIYTFRLLLISPGDVSEERYAISTAITHWNAQIGDALKARVDLVRWETHGTPDLSSTPQEVLDRQIVDGCDFGLAVFWSRLGTPTPSHASGSVEEIERLRAQGKRLMLYFCDRPVPANVDLAEYRRLRHVRAQYEKQGFVGTYVDPADLQLAVLGHLSSAVKSLLPQRLGVATSSPLAQALSMDASSEAGGNWSVDSAPLASREEMYSELARLIRNVTGPLHIRGTSILPRPYQVFDREFTEYLTLLAKQIASATRAGEPASYSLVIGFPLSGDGTIPEDRREALEYRLEPFRNEGVQDRVTIFHTSHQWLLDVFTINDDHAVIGFPTHATDPHLRHALRVTGEKFVSQFVQWFDTCVLPSATLIDSEKLELR